MKNHQNEHSGNLGGGRSHVHSVGMDMDPTKRNLATQLLTGMVDLERADPAELSAMMYDEMRQTGADDDAVGAAQSHTRTHGIGA